MLFNTFIQVDDEHDVQLVAPGVVEYFPGAHNAQPLMLVFAKYPGAHIVHRSSVSPFVGRYL